MGEYRAVEDLDRRTGWIREAREPADLPLRRLLGRAESRCDTGFFEGADDLGQIPVVTDLVADGLDVRCLSGKDRQPVRVGVPAVVLGWAALPGAGMKPSTSRAKVRHSSRCGLRIRKYPSERMVTAAPLLLSRSRNDSTTLSNSSLRSIIAQCPQS